MEKLCLSTQIISFITSAVRSVLVLVLFHELLDLFYIMFIVHDFCSCSVLHVSLSLCEAFVFEPVSWVQSVSFLLYVEGPSLMSVYAVFLPPCLIMLIRFSCVSLLPLCLYSVCSRLMIRVMISGLFCQLSQFRSFLRSVLAILGSVCSLTFGIKPTHSNATFLLLGSSLIKSTHLLLRPWHTVTQQ